MTTHTRTRHSTLLSAAILTGATIATLGAVAGTSAHAGTDGARPAAPLRAPSACDPADLHVDAAPAVPAENIVTISVTRADAAYLAPDCTIDRIPTVTFGDLDGTARPVPPVSSPSSPYVLAPGETAHAAVRTAPGMDADGAELVQHVTVAAAPEHAGSTFDADDLGAGEPGVYVYDPITTWWQPAQGEAIEQIRDQLP